MLMKRLTGTSASNFATCTNCQHEIPVGSSSKSLTSLLLCTSCCKTSTEDPVPLEPSGCPAASISTAKAAAPLLSAYLAN